MDMVFGGKDYAAKWYHMTAASSSVRLRATGTGVVHYVDYPICLNGEIMTPFLPPSISLLPYIDLIHLVRSTICKDGLI